MIDDRLRARYRSAATIRREGAIGNLFDGPSIAVQGLRTRLLAWPGTGYQTEAVHVTTVRPGEESRRYAYDLAEEAILCRHGSAEVWLRGQWATLRARDLAYVPEGVPRQIRNPAGNRGDAILVHQLCPPQFDLYVEPGFYNPRAGAMNGEAVERAKVNADPAEPPDLDEMAYRDDQPALRAWSLSPAEVRAGGALFNVRRGTAFSGIGLPMRLVLWPGAGTRMVGFNYAYCGTGVTDAIHSHPVSDEFLVLWSGAGQLFTPALGWVDAQASDVVLAPCGVMHGHRSVPGLGPSWMGGFASPPQLDLMIPTDYYRDGLYAHPDSSVLSDDEAHAADRA